MPTASGRQSTAHSLTQAQQIVTRNLENMGFQVPRHGVGRTIVGLRKRQG